MQKLIQKICRPAHINSPESPPSVRKMERRISSPKSGSLIRSVTTDWWMGFWTYVVVRRNRGISITARVVCHLNSEEIISARQHQLRWWPVGLAAGGVVRPRNSLMDIRRRQVKLHRSPATRLRLRSGRTRYLRKQLMGKLIGRDQANPTRSPS